MKIKEKLKKAMNGRKKALSMLFAGILALTLNAGCTSHEIPTIDSSDTETIETLFDSDEEYREYIRLKERLEAENITTPVLEETREEVIDLSLRALKGPVREALTEYNKENESALPAEETADVSTIVLSAIDPYEKTPSPGVIVTRGGEPIRVPATGKLGYAISLIAELQEGGCSQQKIKDNFANIMDSAMKCKIAIRDGLFGPGFENEPEK